MSRAGLLFEVVPMDGEWHRAQGRWRVVRRGPAGGPRPQVRMQWIDGPRRRPGWMEGSDAGRKSGAAVGPVAVNGMVEGGKAGRGEGQQLSETCYYTQRDL